MQDLFLSKIDPVSSIPDTNRSSRVNTSFDGNIKPVKSKKKGGLRRDLSCVIRDLITALALCHNVTPTYPDEKNKDLVEY
jgi:hypothetical protein